MPPRLLDVHRDEQQAAVLQRVLNSAELRRSARLRDFLQYVGDLSLAGATHVSEQEIGVSVFGRSADYDTSIDNIVRVNATHLRKRLEAYFNEAEGVDEPLILTLPRGSYIPVFEKRALEQVLLEPSAVIAPEDPADMKAETKELPGPKQWQSVALWSVLALAVVFAGLSVHFWLQNRTLRAAGGSTASAFFSSFFSNSQPTEIVLADTSFSLVEDMTGHPIPLKQYADRTYIEDLKSISGNDQLRRDVELVATRNNGSLGEFRFAETMIRQSPAKVAIQLESAREFRAINITNRNLVFAGSQRSNPWVELFKDRLDLVLNTDSQNGSITVTNRHPRAGEPAQYALTADPSTYAGFCLIAFLPNGDQGNHVLLIEGTGSEETQAAGDFLASDEKMAEVYKVLGSKPRHFEVLLGTRKLYGSPLSTQVLAAHPR